MSCALTKARVRPGDRIGIVAPTSVRWEIAQMALLTHGAVVVGIDPNYPDDQLSEVLTEISLTALFVHDAATLTRIGDELLGALDWICCLYGSCERDNGRGLSFEEMVKQQGSYQISPSKTCARPEDAAIIVFSSGTTGRPKPIQYSHAQIIVATNMILEAFRDVDESTRLLCWLPLANLFQRMINICAVARGAPSFILSDPREVMHQIKDVNPHLMIGVPRFFERVHDAIQNRMSEGTTALMTRWALALGRRAARAKRAGFSLSKVDRCLHWIADRLILNRLRGVFGANLRYLISGSAPMPVWLLEFFDAIDLPVYEAYGVSENIVPIAINRPGARRQGTVGRPLSVNEVQLAPDGEIRVRGPGVFSGYWPTGGPNVLEAGGFWPTGDLGEFDSDGFLRIIGRKSETFKSSTGRWVSPVEIEEKLRRIPYVGYALVFGAGRKILVALVGVDSDRFATAIERNARIGTRSVSHETLCVDVAAATQCLAKYLRPTGILVTSKPLSIVGGELTTNLKLRRNAIEARYSAQLEQLYEMVERRNSHADERSDSIVILTA